MRPRARSLLGKMAALCKPQHDQDEDKQVGKAVNRSQRDPFLRISSGGSLQEVRSISYFDSLSSAVVHTGDTAATDHPPTPHGLDHLPLHYAANPKVSEVSARASTDVVLCSHSTDHGIVSIQLVHSSHHDAALRSALFVLSHVRRHRQSISGVHSAVLQCLAALRLMCI
jgi:hypothetical protein